MKRKILILLRIVFALIVGSTVVYLISHNITLTKIELFEKEHIELSLSYGLIFFIFFENVRPLYFKDDKE